jgi:hypothetical protein
MPPACPRQLPPTVLALDEIDEGSTRLEFDVEVEQLGLEDTDIVLTAPVSVQLTVGRTMHMYTVRGRLQTSVVAVCCRLRRLSKPRSVFCCNEKRPVTTS